MPFRIAHLIVGRIAASGHKPNLPELDTVAMEFAGFRPSERGFSVEVLEKALDPRSNVAIRSNTGGPAPAETKRMVSDRLIKIDEEKDRISEMRSRVDNALDALKNMR
jgi:argininosuccinate lyase